MDHNQMDMQMTTAKVGDMSDMTDMSGMTDMTTGMTGMPMTTGMDMGGGGCDMMMSPMKMYFHFGINETVLFKGWMIHDDGSLVLSIIGVFLFALLYEALKFSRQWLIQYAASRHQAQFANMNGAGLPKQSVSYMGSTPFTFWHLLQTFLHVVQTFVSYLLMMIFMTFNAWLCIAIIVGAGAGYFAFGWRAKIVVDVHGDHCH